MFSSSSSSSSSASISSASNPIDEVALTASESFLIPPLENIVAQYSFDINDSAWLTKPFTLFGIPSLPKQISLITEAAPLDQVETFIRAAWARDKDIFSRIFKVGGMEGTLCQLAMIGLDQTIENDEGMAERLMKLHAELSPDTYQDALDRAKLAASVETTAEKTAREALNLAAINQVFDAIKQNDANTPDAIATFKAFIKSTKPNVMTTNQYHLNLIHLIACAFDVLASRGRELAGGWYGELGDKFCLEVIGDAIESNVPPRIRQILQHGLCDLHSANKTAPRFLDAAGVRFSAAGSNNILGVNSFYDNRGGLRAGGVRLRGHWCGRRFSKLISSYYSSSQDLCNSLHVTRRVAV